MKARRGAIRTLGLGTVAALVAAGLGAMATPAAHAADPVLPGPTSSKWTAVKKDGVVATDPTNDMTTGYLNVTPAGGALGTTTAYFSADLEYAYFRFHVAQQPTDIAGGYVVQFDTDGNTADWERAIRYDSVARTVTLYSTDDNSGVKAVGTAGVVVPPAQTAGTSYAGADGGAHVAFAVPRTRLTDAGVKLGEPMVMGTTSEAGVGLNASKPLLGQAPADVVGTGNFGLGTPAWSSLSTDAFALDSDGDGVADSIDNCPVNANPGQEDDDAALEATYPPNHALDGTEGDGNVCDATPRGQDLIDGDGVGALDDQCGEQYGLLANGCPAQSTTAVVLRYSARRTRFSGVVRADYDQCVPRRSVTVLKSVAGPDRRMGTVRTRANGRYVLDKRARKGTYYASVDPKWTLGARCFGKKSPKIQVR
jgi:hypothetical protein